MGGGCTPPPVDHWTFDRSSIPIAAVQVIQ